MLSAIDLIARCESGCQPPTVDGAEVVKVIGLENIQSTLVF